MNTSAAANLVARILLAAIFLWAGWGKVGGFEGTVGRIGAAGLPMGQILAAGAIALEIGGGLMLIAGWHARWAALALAMFSVVTGIAFHAFWSVPPEQVVGQKIHFLKNIAIAGGLLMLWAHGVRQLALRPDPEPAAS